MLLQVRSPLPTPPSCSLRSEAALEEVHLRLDSYLPREVLQELHRGFPSNYRFKETFRLYEWQALCLNRPGITDAARPRNLVYCAPTSGGKTLVAEILMYRRLLATHRPVLLVLPFVALCEEKARELEPPLQALGLTVRRFFGEESSREILDSNTGAIVCTIEKANTIVNRLIENEVRSEHGLLGPEEPQSTLRDLSGVVVDELHMVGDPERGYLLEEMLSKLVFAQRKWQAAQGPQLPARESGGSLTPGEAPYWIQASCLIPCPAPLSCPAKLVGPMPRICR